LDGVFTSFDSMPKRKSNLTRQGRRKVRRLKRTRMEDSRRVSNTPDTFETVHERETPNATSQPSPNLQAGHPLSIEPNTPPTFNEANRPGEQHRTHDIKSHPHPLRAAVLDPELCVDVEMHNLGLMDQVCGFCGAKNFKGERPSDGAFSKCFRRAKLIYPHCDLTQSY